ncbi:hypothetical protein [Gemmobacter sp. LW-1]|uniref:hypothetical protein n=1 Tax=Gemmobacter sp. LW-1 TaxID=1529005 RepID=UPI0006C74DAA|nr:hypothetical protein [Gemmobacter sp. LW-1]
MRWAPLTSAPSVNDVPEIREIFDRFQLTGVTTSYTISRTGNDQAGARAELLVSNFPVTV